MKIACTNQSISAFLSRGNHISVTAALLLLTATATSNADTFVSGNVSGAWTLSGSRYIVTGDITVPSGNTLTIEPGVEVIMGQNTQMLVYGRIIAEGTATQRITFRGANSTMFWNRIYVGNPTVGLSKFVNCSFSDATDAIYYVLTANQTATPKVLNCSFSNCQNWCIYAYAGPVAAWPVLSPMIYNCAFLDSTNGIGIFLEGYRTYAGFGSFNNYQPATNATVANNVFKNISNTALLFHSSPVYTSSPKSAPQYINNVFYQCGTAIARTGTLSILQNDLAGYNCLFGNTTDFSGYPNGIHGTVSGTNANGTDCDLISNIFNDPGFVGESDLELEASSPCIDAGNPASAYLDTHLPPSQGTTVNDMGIYGGPYAANSLLTNAYNGSESFMITAQRYAGITVYPTDPGTYRIDYTEDLGSDNWTQAISIELTAEPVTWIDLDSPSVSRRFYRAVILPQVP